ncbi:MAG TPA: AzlC family ABC transporter permease [Mycobacteriales bacterium]|nr:AzlC family ABC transporter permease [Mycobacteriales bacterium]
MADTERRAVVRAATAIAVTTGVYGIAFGAAGIAAGLGWAATCVLSLTMFTGASQFALVGVIGAGGGVAAAVGGALLLGSRNTLYGLRLASLLQVRGLRRAVAAHGVIDETTAMASLQERAQLARLAFVATFGLLYVAWNLGTAIGAVGARLLGDPATFGLDAAAPAAFLALLAPRLRAEPKGRRVAIGGAVIAIATTPFAPAGVPILCAAAAVVLGRRR